MVGDRSVGYELVDEKQLAGGGSVATAVERDEVARLAGQIERTGSLIAASFLRKSLS